MSVKDSNSKHSPDSLKEIPSVDWLDLEQDRDKFLKYTNEGDVMTRPIWQLMSELKMYKNCQRDDLVNSIWLCERVVNIPSSVPNGALTNIEALSL